MTAHTIGVDFGSESARALLVEVQTGREVAVAQAPYPSAVIDRALPGSGVPLPPDWALQDPDDYLSTMRTTVAQVLRGIDPADVIGVGIDFTSCTMLPTLADGTPLCRLPEYAAQPHAWVKLWKHHAAQPQADRLNALARRHGGMFLDLYGGRISSEWFIPKALQILEEAPGIYHAADRLIEAQDWIVWQLTGREARSAVAAGYKSIYLPESGGYPSRRFLAELHPELGGLVEEKMTADLCHPGDRVGGLSPDAARDLGLLPGTSVAAANLDAVVSVAACGVTDPGRMVLVMGTSTCDILLGDERQVVEGMCGVVPDAVVPGLWAYEAGQSCVGDLFGWFARTGMPAAYQHEADRRDLTPYEYLESLAGRLRPGESGLVALDWWNGNRSVLVDADLTGLLLGMTLTTRPEEIYRALLEATAFGQRVIVESFREAGVAVHGLVACGGLPHRSPLLMQILADVTNLPIEVAESRQTPALGAALHAAVAAGPDRGGYPGVAKAVAHMAPPGETFYRPQAGSVAVYDQLFHDYRELHDYFGRSAGNRIMRRLKGRRLGNDERTGVR